MSHPKPILVDNEELTQIAKRHFGNRSILYPAPSLRRLYLPTPLIYLHPFVPDAVHLLCQRDGKILASASLLNFKGSDRFDDASNPYQNDNILFLGGLCVRSAVRNQGYAGILVREIFEMVARETKILQISEFSNAGEKYLAPKIAQTHIENYPAVKVLYPYESFAIQGFQQYVPKLNHHSIFANLQFK